MQIVFDLNRVPQTLGAELGSGGEGTVHALHGRPDIAVKLYAPDKLASRGSQLRRKVEAQIEVWPVLKTQPLAWPRLSVFDERGEWVGYAMRRGTGAPLRKLAHPGLSGKYFPGLTRRFVAKALRQLLDCVYALHHHRIHLGDINLNNFLCDPATGGITLIDCDSFQIVSASGEHFPCPVGSLDSTPPEHLGANFPNIRRTMESDAFSLAILMFQCLMLGRHPYDSIGGCNPVDNLRGGHFPYGEGGSRPGSQGAIPAGPWYAIWSHLSGGLKNAFIQTFSAGANDPRSRTRIDEWRDLLEKYVYSIGQGYLSDEIRPLRPKPRGGARPSK